MDYSSQNMLPSIKSNKPAFDTNKTSTANNTYKGIEEQSFEGLLKNQIKEHDSTKNTPSKTSVENPGGNKELKHEELLAKIKEALQGTDATSIEVLKSILALLSGKSTSNEFTNSENISSESTVSESSGDLINELISKLISNQEEQKLTEDVDRATIEQVISQLIMDLFAPSINTDETVKNDLSSLITSLENTNVPNTALNDLLQVINSMKASETDSSTIEGSPFMDLIQSINAMEVKPVIDSDLQALSNSMNTPKPLNMVVSDETVVADLKVEVVPNTEVTKENVVVDDALNKASTLLTKPLDGESIEVSKQAPIKEVISENEALASDKKLANSEIVKVVKNEKSDIDTAYEKLSTYQAQKEVSVVNGKVVEVPSTLDKFTSEQMKTFDIPTQIKVGIEEQLAKTNNEFVLKLKPEGLGEVVVKLVNHGGNIEINLITNNLQTKNYLNEAMANLKDSLQPFNAQVKEVTYDNQSSYFHQSNFSDQQSNFTNQQQAQQSSYYRSGYYENTSEEMDYNIDLLLNSATIARRA